MNGSMQPEEKNKILRARAKVLAGQSETKQADEHIEVFEFLLAQEKYGIQSSYVREVYPLNSRQYLARRSLLPALLTSAEKLSQFVDEILYEQEVLMKNLGKLLSRVRNIAGANAIGNGRVVPILNVHGPFRFSKKEVRKLGVNL